MRRSILTMALGAAMALAVHAQTKAEKREYESLVTELRGASNDYAGALDDAREEMRADNGALTNAISAELVYRREKLDHWRSRLTAHCAITGLPFPQLSTETSASPAPIRDAAEDVRAQARRLLLPGFRADALAIARQVSLPVIPPTRG